MKRLLLILWLLSTGAWAQDIRVLHVLTNDAVRYLDSQGASASAFVQAQIDRTNAQYAASGVTARIVNAGIRTGVCCGAATHFETIKQLTYTDAGAMPMIRESYLIAAERDLTNADVTMVIADFDDGANNYDVSGRAGYLCNNNPDLPSSAENAYAGINVRNAMWFDPMLYAHEMGHILCMQHGLQWFRKWGTTLADCQVWFTAGEANEVSRETRTFNTGLTSYCWKPQASSPCYSDGHSAVASIPPTIVTTRPVGVCSYKNARYVTGNAITVGSLYNEDVECKDGGNTTLLGTFGAVLVSTTPTPGFVCNNVRKINLFSNPNVLVDGVPIGWPSPPATNSADLMNQAAQIVKNYHTVKLAWRLKEKALQKVFN